MRKLVDNSKNVEKNLVRVAEAWHCITNSCGSP